MVSSPQFTVPLPGFAEVGGRGVAGGAEVSVARATAGGLPVGGTVSVGRTVVGAGVSVDPGTAGTGVG